MSAVTPIADKGGCGRMSAKCQKRTCVIAVVIFAKRHRWTLGNAERSFATFVSLT